MDASGTMFGGKFNLVDSHVAGDVFISGLPAANGVDISGTQVGGYVSLAGSSSKGPIKAINTQIAGNVVFDDKGLIEGSVTLEGARVGGTLQMLRAAFAAPVKLRNMHVLGDVLMDAARFYADLDMLAMHINGDLMLRGASVVGDLTATNIDVQHDLALNQGAHFGGIVNMFDARVANTIHMEKANFEKGMFATNAQVAGDMLLNDLTFGAAVVLVSVRIGGDLNWPGRELANST